MPSISSSLLTIHPPKLPFCKPKPALRIREPHFQLNIRPLLLTFSIAHRVRRKRQRPPSSRVIESPRQYAFGFYLYMSRLGLPINASDFSGVEVTSTRCR